MVALYSKHTRFSSAPPLVPLLFTSVSYHHRLTHSHLIHGMIYPLYVHQPSRYLRTSHCLCSSGPGLIELFLLHIVIVPIRAPNRMSHPSLTTNPTITRTTRILATTTNPPSFNNQLSLIPIFLPFQFLICSIAILFLMHPFPFHPTSLTPPLILLPDLVSHPFHFLSKKQQKHYHFDFTSSLPLPIHPKTPPNSYHSSVILSLSISVSSHS